ncbi:polysaccharide biosynthesis C-terminal domain-containing protein [Bosea sp. OK403]|uniref:lipopolysaccharide biosynthesis protein n=1 Tax=Bosea sp. OK403 TaxID=1855286 RepID=UPI001587BD44|nr:polysaccharide biosynthesis C-terminal domain-containing protein [Bosea sp. OK403]
MTAARERQGVMVHCRTAVGPVLSLGNQVLSSTCNFLTTILLTRALGLEAFGLYTMAWLPLHFAMSLQIGLIVSPMMSIAGKEDGAEADAYYAVVGIHQLVYAAVAAAAIFGTLTLMTGSSWPLHDVALPAAVAGACYLTQDFLRRCLFARRRPVRVLLLDIANFGLRLGALAALWHEGLIGIATALWVLAAAAAASAVCGLGMAGPFHWKPEIFAAVTRRQWRSARWLVLTGSLQWMSGYSGLIVTAGLFGPRILGALRVAQSLLAVMNVAREGLENIVPPLAGKALAERGLPGLRHVLGRALFGAALIGTAAMSGLGLFGQWLLHRLYGGEILEFSWVIIWSSLGFPMALVTVVLTCAFRALEQTRSVFLAVLVGACFNLVAVYPAAVVFGVAGLIAVSLLSQLIVLAVLAVLVARISGLRVGAPPRHDSVVESGATAISSP